MAAAACVKETTRRVCQDLSIKKVPASREFVYNVASRYRAEKYYCLDERDVQWADRKLLLRCIMSKQNAQAASSLQAITTRLSSVSVKQLSNLILPISRLLTDCKTLLSQPETSLSKGSPDAICLHKFKTQLNALLLDKTPEGRYAATVLIRTTLDVGGHEQLAKSTAWVRGLLSILGRSTDPPASKRLAITTLTRIFMLTHNYQSLVREITTPTLPAYITACLNIVAPKAAFTKPAQLLAQRVLLEPVIESFLHLVPNHPNIFRTFLSQINSLVAPLIAPTPSSESDDQPLPPPQSPTATAAAQRLFTLLPICAPKQPSSSVTTTTTQTSGRPSPPSSEAWSAALTSTVTAIHTTADLIFRAVHEDWRSVAGVRAQPNAPQSYDGPLAAPDAAALALPHAKGTGLPGWSGVHAGGERMAGLLALLRTFIEGQTAAAVVLPVGAIVDVLARVMSVAAPAAETARAKKKRGMGAYSMRVNDAIGRDERLGLWAEVPAVHAAACEVVEVLVVRLGAAALPVADVLLENLLWVFERSGSSTMVREAAFGALTELVEVAGGSFTREQARALDNAVKAACGDLLPGLADPQRAGKDQVHATNGTGASGKKTETSINADALFKNPSGEHGYQSALNSAHDPRPTDLQDAAHDFLVAYTTIVPSRHMSAATRAIIDRTAVLSNDAEAMLASVMNPPHNAEGASKSRSSILPHLARAFPQRLEVEALLRPRMPPVHVGQQDAELDGEEEIEEDDEQEDVAEDEDKMDTDEAAPAVAKVDPFAPVEHAHSASQWPTRLAASTDDTAFNKSPAPESLSALGKRSVSDAAPLGQPEEKRPRVAEVPDPVAVKEPEAKPAVQISGKSHGLLEDSDSDDDDNFVIPALTLEPDTEDEDEDEAEEDDDENPEQS